MIIEINDTLTLDDISQAFAESFPFLIIRFFRYPHKRQQASALKEQLDGDTTVAQSRTVHGTGSMEINSWHKTGDVEQEFAKLFGLFVQVFRREGSAWIQTADTDLRTLEEQNEAGRNAG